MTSFTYDTLWTAILSYTEAAGSDFEAMRDVIVQNGMEKLVRDLDLEIFKNTVTTKTMAANSATLDKDSSILVADDIWWQDPVTGKWKLLKKRDYGFCQSYWTNPNSTSTPKYWADATDSQVYLAPTPNANYPTKTRGLVRPRPLSASNPQNWLSINVGDLLLYACLIQSERYLMAVNTARVQDWKDEYGDQLEKAKEELKDLKRIPYEPINRNAEVDKQ